MPKSIIGMPMLRLTSASMPPHLMRSWHLIVSAARLGGIYLRGLMKKRKLTIGAVILRLALSSALLFANEDPQVDSQILSWALPLAFAALGGAIAALVSGRRDRLGEASQRSLTLLDSLTAAFGGIVGTVLVFAEGTNSRLAVTLTVAAFATSALSIIGALMRGPCKRQVSMVVLVLSAALAVAIPIVQLRDIAGEWVPALIIEPLALSLGLFILAFLMVKAYWGGRPAS